MLAKERRLMVMVVLPVDVQDVAAENLWETGSHAGAGKIEMAKLERVCPWDPGAVFHDVDTLILTGDADPVTAGDQAEYFFEKWSKPASVSSLNL
jgi:hypothetical protein